MSDALPYTIDELRDILKNNEDHGRWPATVNSMIAELHQMERHKVSLGEIVSILCQRQGGTLTLRDLELKGISRVEWDLTLEPAADGDVTVRCVKRNKLVEVPAI